MSGHDDTRTLATALLARRSITPDDAGCTPLIAERLARAGFACERLDRGGVTNLWARAGTARPLVCIAGHTDVVPPGPVEQWTSDPFAPVAREGRLYARGASDMKGPLAAAITAVERFVGRHGSGAGSLAVLLTSDEEGPAVDGTAAVVETLRARGERIDYGIVTEPTSTDELGDAMKNGRRGSLSGTLVVRGRQTHIAYPHLGRNPIHDAAPAVAELVSTEWDRGSEDFPPTSFQISNIQAGTGATNIIPATMRVQFNFRFAPASTVEGLQARVADILARHDVNGDITWTVGGQPFLTPRGRLTTAMADAVRDVTGRTPVLATGGGISDARFIATIASEVVEFGPVHASIHQVDEHIGLADLAPLSRIYERVLERLLIPE